MRVLLITPPMTQINTPYPATAYLTGFLKSRGHETYQADFSLELLLSLLSQNGLIEIFDQLKSSSHHSKSIEYFLSNFKRYLSTVENVVRFLQSKDRTLAYRLGDDSFLPRGPRFRALENWEGDDGQGLEMAFGALGIQDRAQYFASLYIDDLADVIRDGIDSRFELSRYAEKLSASAPTFDPILEALNENPTLVDKYLDKLTVERMHQIQPEVVGLSVPFPGNVYGAFRIASQIKKHWPNTTIALGGGYVNTELRNLKDIRVFDFVDYLTLDDGELPLLCILEKQNRLCRTLTRENHKVVLRNATDNKKLSYNDTGFPSYEGLFLDKYLSLCEVLNPMHRMWSDGRWNKLTLAHGCYWKQCTFCDTSLDYISRFEMGKASKIVDRIEKIISETNQTGFHFVDEAAPPKLLGALANEMIKRNLTVTWWANIRFEKTFSYELAKRLAESGCVAMSGGLEVASDRLLKLMKKGVQVEQVAKVTHAFSQAGIMVHAYLMYGFPTQTVQETLEALERVRQLFLYGCLQSAYWHRFSVTVHSPIGKNPESYGIQLFPLKSSFAENDVPFEDSTGIDHGTFTTGLNKAVYNFMHGAGLEKDVRTWFDFPVPKPKVAKDFVASIIFSDRDKNRA